MDIRKYLCVCLVLLAASLLVAPPLWAGTPFRNSVVTVNNPLAAEAGAQALEKGGNAIDAIAAIQFAMNVVEPEYSGIGGGGFMVIHLAQTNETFMLDCREKAPAAATANQFVATGGTQTDGLAVGVPGTLMCVDTALKNWGTTTLAEALQPAIMLADQGFNIVEPLASDIQNSRTNIWPETRAVFRPGGVAKKKGDLLQQPDLANTFRLIAQQGADVFYHGEIADAIVGAQQRYTSGPAGAGRMQKSDLEAYNVVRRDLVSVNYRGYTFASTSPPSSGGLTVGQMLEMLEQFPLGDVSQGFGFGATNTLHVMIEAMRLAFADRGKWMGDEDSGFCAVPKTGLLNPAYAKNVRGALIQLNHRITPNPTAGNPLPYNASGPQELVVAAATPEEPKEGHTTSFAVADKWGNMVAYTTTIEAGWGTGIMVPGYGFLLNNELTDFNTTPLTDGVGCNNVAPFKRPRSSIAPSILFKDGVPIVAFGSPGGATIINTVLQITLNLIDHGMTIQEAIDAPRISVTATSGGVTREPGFPVSDVENALRALGHTSWSTAAPVGGIPGIGAVNAVAIDLQAGKQYGGTDYRRGGAVIYTAAFDAYLHGTGSNANPGTLFLDDTAPTAPTAKYKDSASVKFSGGNPWVPIGTWAAGPRLTLGIVSGLSDLHAWLGLKNSDDQGTQFDLRAEVYKNDLLVASGVTRCITNITRNPAMAKEAAVPFNPFPPVQFNGTTDGLSLKVLTRIGTNADETKCAGHANAVGLRLYFDTVGTPSKFGTPDP
jgi:gamma-glutamyltranspeptidase/glutathione hydrolase